MGIRILIADRQEMFREVLKRLLESESDFEVIADTDDGEQLIKLVLSFKPDVLLLDLKLRRLSGMDALREIAALKTSVRPILLTDALKKSEVIQALLWGACGVVYKSDPGHLLFKSIRNVASGEYWVSHDGIGELVKNLRSLTTKVEQNAKVQAGSLSRQQQQIVEAIAAGCSNKEIAEELSVSERTVKYHLTRIFGKLGVSGRMQLARFSLKNEVASVPSN
jgi:DNA-binding NarL/FixJ family response regulator